MTKVILMAILAVMALAATVSGAVNETAKEDFSEINLSEHKNWAPFMDPDGMDISVKVSKLVFAKLGAEVNVPDVGNWDDVQKSIETGMIDGAVGAYINDVRKNYSIFSIPYANDPVVFYFPSEKSFVYNGTDSLVGKKIVAMFGDSYGQAMDIILANLSVIRVYEPVDAFKMLDNGSVDLFIYAYWSGQIVNDCVRFKVDNSTSVANPFFHIQISKKSPWASRMDEINASLQKVIDSDAIDQMLKEAKVSC